MRGRPSVKAAVPIELEGVAAAQQPRRVDDRERKAADAQAIREPDGVSACVGGEGAPGHAGARGPEARATLGAGAATAAWCIAGSCRAAEGRCFILVALA
jgi:hypothetical protein